jgi:hypothetical protein
MITIVWNPHGFHMIQPLSKGMKWTGRDYSFSNCWSSRCGQSSKKVVHADNVGSHVGTCVTEYMNRNSVKRAPHPPYSPDSPPSDFYLFGSVKYPLQGHEFTEGAELVSAVSEILNQIATDTLADVFDDWIRRSQRCIDISGEYVEYRLFLYLWIFANYSVW